MRGNQGNLFGSAGDQLKAQGISRVLAHTPEAYAASFLSVISHYRSGHEFTSEDVTKIVGQPWGHPNTVGALIASAAKGGLIVMTGRRVKARRPNQHSAKLEVWRRV